MTLVFSDISNNIYTRWIDTECCAGTHGSLMTFVHPLTLSLGSYKVDSCGFERNVSTTVGQIAIKFDLK